MLIGYARVSTVDQDTALQLDALEPRRLRARLRGARLGREVADRPVLAEAMDYAREGDVIAVWRLDRFGRSLKDLISKVGDLRERGVGFRSLTEAVDTTTPGPGKLVFHIFGALAEFERELIRERTMAGLEAARARGRKGGRPSKMTRAKVRQASVLLADPGADVGAVCETLGVSKSTLYTYVGPDGTVRKTPAR